MKRNTIAVRTLVQLLFGAAVFLLASGGAQAQLAVPNGVIASPNLGVPGAPSPLPGSVGIPLGAVELGIGGGLSPPPGSPLPTLPFPSFSASNITGMGAFAGSGSSLGTGLSPLLVPPASPLPMTSGLGVGFPPSGIPNYGVPGLQPLHGSPAGTP